MSAPTQAERARTIVASRNEGALSTIALDPAGYPYGSHVIYAAVGSAPIFLISKLAEHTKNLEADARASLLVVEVAHEGLEALARGRVTLLGTCTRLEDRTRVEAAFLERHPDARKYASFPDFSFWTLNVEAVRYVGGFGRMSWIDAKTWSEAEVDPLLDAAPSILAHMNGDHADACLAYARAFGDAGEAIGARMIGVDRHGFDLAIDTSEGVRTARIAFPEAVASPDAVRKTLVAMVRDARSRLGSAS